MLLLSLLKEISLHPKNAEELKGLILQLAFEGRLTSHWREQNTHGQTAEELLEAVTLSKEELIQNKTIRKIKSSPVDESEKSFDVPSSWVWTRMIDYLDVRDGTHDSPKFQTTGIPLVTSKNLYTKKLDLSNVKYISEKDHAEISKRSKVDRDDILFAMIGSIGNPVIVDVEPNFSIKNVALIKYYNKELVEPYYILHFLEYATKQFKEDSGGAVQSFVSLKKLRLKELPLPPLKEQRAIVKVINQLFGEVEQLEELTKKRVSLKEDFVTSALAKLTESESTASQWDFLKDLFSTFFTEVSGVKKLRETILQLAVQGKLTYKWRANNPDTVPASKLLERIEAEKQQLIAEKKIKKEKQLSAITEEEIPYELPEGWVWTRAGSVTDIIAGASFKSGDFNQSGGVKCIKITNAGVREFVETNDFLPEEFDAKYPNHLIKEGDLILALTRPYINDGLKISTCPSTYHNSLLNQRVASIRSMSRNIYHPFLFTFLQSPKVLIHYKSMFDGKSQQPNMKMKDIVELPIPIAPLEEQQVIVEKVNSLMALCDELEQQIETSHTLVEQLMHSCLKEVFVD